MINLLIFPGASIAQEDTKPPHQISTFTIASRILQKTLKNSHYKIIGSCTWLVKDMPPKIAETPAIEQFLPDLVVTVSNRPNENPWLEAHLLYENEVALNAYQKACKLATGSQLGFGENSSQIISMHMNDERTRVVKVIGSPNSFYQLPYLSHRPETKFGTPYYISEADAVMDRTEAAELAYMATRPHLLMNHDIGLNGHVWGPEIPRLMRVTQPSNFRASVVAAMHAVDIVTNHNKLHVVHSTTNFCGKNCSIANAIFDPKHEKVIWQEVYPLNRNIQPGSATDFGIEDDIKGNGNYVFVLWRKYRGCTQYHGKLLRKLSHPIIGLSKKR